MDPAIPPSKRHCPEMGGRDIEKCTKYLVLKCANEGENLTKVSPFLIHKVLSNYIPGPLESVKKLRDGTLLIKTRNKNQSEKLLALKTLHNIPIKVETHKTLNTCRGVITSYDLLYVSEEEITKEMASQGVTSCRRLSKRQDGEFKNTTSVVLTFALEKPPEKVYVGYEACSVRPYIPSPLRCFQCNRYGHTAQTCKSKSTCPKCAKDKHDGQLCSSPFQ